MSKKISKEDRIFNRITWIANILTIVFSILLLVDISLDTQLSLEKITYKDSYRQSSKNGSRSRLVYGFYTHKSEYPLTNPNLYNAVQKGDTIALNKTPIFKEVRSAVHKQAIYNTPNYTIYKGYFFLPIALFLFSLLAIITRRYIQKYHNFFTVAAFAISIYLAISMITNNMV